MGPEAYLDLGGEIQEDDLVCRFRLRPARDAAVEASAGAVAAESSIGTWTDVKTLSAEMRSRLRARVVSIEGDLATIAYPDILFEKGNMAQVYSGIAGNIFGMKGIERLRLESVRFPLRYLQSFPGPQRGVAGIRETLGIYGRPLVGTIVKPKLGLDPKAHAQVVYDAMEAGCDVVKDDENLTSQPFSPFSERLAACLDARKRAEDKTGEAKGYIPNVTAPAQVMLRRAAEAARLGARFVMVDFITAGWSGVQSLRDAGLGMVLHGHRAMHAAVTRIPDHGIAMCVLAASARAVGIDQLHVGTAVGKMAGGEADVVKSVDALRGETTEQGGSFPAQDWTGFKRTMPIASGGLHPGHVPALYRIFGKEVILQFGGGIHGHPDGTAAGARAVRQSLQAALEGMDLSEFRKGAPALDRALKQWEPQR